MRPSRLRRLLLFLLIVLLLGPALWLIFGTRSHRITRVNFDAIYVGMDPDNVLVLLGEENVRFFAAAPGAHEDVAWWCFSEDDESWLVPGNEIWVEARGSRGITKKKLRNRPLREVWQRVQDRVRSSLGFPTPQRTDPTIRLLLAMAEGD
jgi:hypothetical protein